MYAAAPSSPFRFSCRIRDGQAARRSTLLVEELDCSHCLFHVQYIFYIPFRRFSYEDKKDNVRVWNYGIFAIS